MWLNLAFFLTFLYLPGGLLLNDYAHSIAGMKSLVDMEGFLIGELTNYTQALREKINTIESFIEAVQVKREFSRRNPAEFVAHPLNAFALIRRLHEDWSYLELFMSRREGLKHLKAIQDILEKEQPTEKDMLYALKGMVTMLGFYDQKPLDTAKGVLLGHQYNANMTTLECLVMASINEEMGADKDVIDWYKAALQQYDELRDGQVLREVFDFKINELYKNLTTDLSNAGFAKASVEILSKASDLDAELWLAQREISDVFKVDHADPIFVPIASPPNECLAKWPVAVKNLSCYYEREISAFLRIAPLKTEILNENPYIIMYYDVIYDTEISRLKNTSLSTLKSPPRTYLEGEYVNLKYTTINKEEQSRLNHRIRDMTGLEVKEDKGFTIFNYGIGGSEGVHQDNLEIHTQMPELGDCHTSIVFFLNNVTEGGAISFPDLQLTVFPQKGNALVWPNLDNALQSIELRHNACPVVLGSKWILVKWLHEGPQVLARPCMEEFPAKQVSKA